MEWKERGYLRTKVSLNSQRGFLTGTLPSSPAGLGGMGSFIFGKLIRLLDMIYKIVENRDTDRLGKIA
jgi:uncharacterized integral membrane protein